MATEWKQFVNNAGSKLTATLTNTATSFSVPTGEGGLFPASGPFWVTVFGTTVAEGHEIILVGSISGDTLRGCTRGQQGTSAAQWATGSNVQLLWTAGGVDQIQEAITALEEGTTLTDLSYSQAVKIRKAGSSSVYPQLTFAHSRGSLSSPTATQANDPVGSLVWNGWTAARAEVPLGEIVVRADGQVPAENDSPGFMEFRVTPNGADVPEAAFTIYNDKSATAGSCNVTLWDDDGYIQTTALKTGTSNSGKCFMAGATEGSGYWGSPLPTLASGYLYCDGSTLSFESPYPTPSTGYLYYDGSVLSWAAGGGSSTPGTDTVGADAIIESETLTFKSLVTHQASTGDIDGIILKRCRGTTASPTSAGSGDGTAISWQFTENTTYREAAKIQVDVAATPSSDMPANLGIWVCKDGSTGLPTDAAMTIGQSQHVAIGDTNFSAAWLTVKGASGTNLPVVKIQQLDTDEPFIEFTGTSAADTTKSISTAAIGTYTGKVRCSINGTDYWIPYYAAT